MPLNTLSSVFLPDPFGPTKACTVLRRTESTTSSTALRPPKCFESRLTSRMIEPSSRATWVVSGKLSVRRNTVHALVGPNGSGKTTLLNVLSGIYKPTNGRLFFDGQAVTRLLPHERAARGIGRTFQNVRLFSAMSVLENIIVGAERPGNAVAVGSTGVEQ